MNDKLYARVDTISSYRAWCPTCVWYGKIRFEEYEADNDRRIHEAEDHYPGSPLNADV